MGDNDCCSSPSGGSIPGEISRFNQFFYKKAQKSIVRIKRTRYNELVAFPAVFCREIRELHWNEDVQDGKL